MLYKVIPLPRTFAFSTKKPDIHVQFDLECNRGEVSEADQLLIKQVQETSDLALAKQLAASYQHCAYVQNILAILYANVGSMKEAFAQYGIAIKLFPNYKTYMAIGHLHRRIGRACIAKQESDTAQQHLELAKQNYRHAFYAPLEKKNLFL